MKTIQNERLNKKIPLHGNEYILAKKLSNNIATLELNLNAMQNMDYLKYAEQNYYKHFFHSDVEKMNLYNVALKLKNKIVFGREI